MRHNTRLADNICKYPRNIEHLGGIVVETICHNIPVVFDFVALISCDHFFSSDQGVLPPFLSKQYSFSILSGVVA